MPYKRPVSVLVVIHTPDREVLLIRRADAGEHWQSVTGSRDATDADLRHTAWREVGEETGRIDEMLNAVANYYEEEFNLLNGNYRIRLKSFTMKENRDLLTQISFDRDKGRIEGVNDYYFSRVAHYRLGLALVSIGDQPFAPEITPASVPANKETGESYVSQRADVFSDWPMVKMAAIQAALQEFDQRVLVLVDAVADPDFWKAAA